jgi:hypothetical protein
MSSENRVKKKTSKLLMEISKEANREKFDKWIGFEWNQFIKRIRQLLLKWFQKEFKKQICERNNVGQVIQMLADSHVRSN